jgi:hypothetical protein
MSPIFPYSIIVVVVVVVVGYSSSSSSWQYVFLPYYPLHTVLYQQVLKQIIIKGKPHQILFFPFTFTVNVKFKFVKPLPHS